MLEALGKKLKIETPVCTALIEIASAALKRDLVKAAGHGMFREENIQKILNDSKELFCLKIM